MNKEKAIEKHDGNVEVKMVKEVPKKAVHVYAILFFVVCFAALLTWIIPAGKYDILKDEATGVAKYLPGTYQQIPATSQNPWDVFNAIFAGWIKGAPLIFVVFIMGAWVQIVEDTRLIEKGFGKLVLSLKGKEKIAIFIVALVMTIIGSFGINPTIPLLPLCIVLSLSLGYDSFVGFAITCLANGLGFSVGAFQIQSVGIAHEIAGIPRFSGYEIRIAIHAICFAVLCFFVNQYMNQIKKNKEESLSYGSDLGGITSIRLNDMDSIKLNIGDILNLFVAVGGFGILIYGVVNWKWGVGQYGPLFLVMALLTGIFGKMGINGLAESFVNGCKKMTYSALIIGFASAISIILSDGHIIDTIVNALSAPIASGGSFIGVILMFLVNGVIDLFIPSNSGQAAAIMPLMVPIADVAGITRQVAVQAYQFGAGFVDLIIPTSTSLFVLLGISGVSYKKYLQWYMKVFVSFCIIAVVSLIILQSIHWGQM